MQRAEERAGLLRSLSDTQEQRAASEHALRLAHQQVCVCARNCLHVQHASVYVIASEHALRLAMYIYIYTDAC